MVPKQPAPEEGDALPLCVAACRIAHAWACTACVAGGVAGLQVALYLILATLHRYRAAPATAQQLAEARARRGEQKAVAQAQAQQPVAAAKQR